MPKWSAVISGTPDAAEFGINADHRSMTKFSNADDEDFKKLSRTLESMLQKSGPKVEANWAIEARMKQGNQLCYSGAGFESDAEIVFVVLRFILALFAGFRYKMSTCTCVSSLRRVSSHGENFELYIQSTRLTFSIAIALKSSKRTFMVPFERDSKFVGRIDILAELDQKLSSQRRVALAGIGGIG